MAASQVQFLRNGIKSLIADPQRTKYSDLMIRCGSKEWHVHKAVVCTQVKHFADSCNKEHGWKEAQEGIIPLDDPKVALERMIQFLYTSDYDDDIKKSSKKPVGPMPLNVLVFTVADKYLIEELKTVAISKFNTRVDQLVDRLDFVETVYEIFRSVREDSEEARMMREKVVGAALTNSSDLLRARQPDEGDGEKYCPLNRLIREIPSFGDEVIAGLSSLAGIHPNAQRLWCTSCKREFFITSFRPKIERAYCPCCKNAVAVRL